MNIPNMLTFLRLVLIPVFIIVFFSGNPNSLLYAIAIFLIAGITDFLDGYLARKYKLITKIGIVLDPLADKLMLLTVLSCLVIGFYIPIWVLIIIASKELFMIFSGIFLYKKGTVIPSNILGKASTIFFYISIFILVFNDKVGACLLYLSVGIAIAALFNYSRLYTKNKKADEDVSSTLNQ
ncbi:CDP-diacylglycerol--glycerol-3-phosphate 3-phosphatidyltransferase [Clostridium swellfunianum]|uniref:CDP-diacylglycerol--glycerol-3-phosphate 3-phosphatidyltransferase n=1 Tax=Clostridium swellfunianum TaxID=1367462 RepID=UPI00202EB62D|nr:CDP-diacylglycerol--glycerol-3-phosphate 3-phosphatidyltransferase [Clostridium swellfunianum]MCM0649215.1 CDP-diacylglycerol--glycerol-3-phosphate 3-phosphatidyltransferase [Clostridium swellfunianum]